MTTVGWECRECRRELDPGQFYRYSPGSGRVGRRGDRCRDCVAWSQAIYRRWQQGLTLVSREEWLARKKPRTSRGLRTRTPR